MNAENRSSVRLRPLNDAGFHTWLSLAIRDYARDKIEAGTRAEADAEENSRQQYAQLLPQGLASKDQYLFAVHDISEDLHVGVLWFGIQRDRPAPVAWIYDLIIFDSYRRKGYGLKAMFALNTEVKAQGVNRIELHVFGHNKAAQALYAKAGYDVASVVMAKNLANS
ncbi:MAG: GNAT family N-acetyltransferase [Chloroflexi bacterium]|nr:GNAT family N-acetyltransferase [Chloroflexota bacterium]